MKISYEVLPNKISSDENYVTREEEFKPELERFTEQLKESNQYTTDEEAEEMFLDFFTVRFPSH